MVHLVTFCIYVLITIFMLGMAGSAIVIAISFVEDFRELFGGND